MVILFRRVVVFQDLCRATLEWRNKSVQRLSRSLTDRHPVNIILVSYFIDIIVAKFASLDISLLARKIPIQIVS